MKHPLFLVFVLGVALTAGLGNAAQAQASSPAAKPQIERYDDWQVRCFDVKSTSPCDMLYGIYVKATGQRILSVSIAYAPARATHFMQVAVPLGIAVQKGITVVAGDFRSTPLVVRRCDNNGCFAELIAAPELVQALLSNSEGKASVEIVADGGKPISLMLSLKGFAKAYAAMKDAAEQRVKTGS